MDVINIILSSYPHIVFRSSPTLSAKGELHTKMTEQELSREEVAMELVDGAQESTSYRTQITESERGWMEDMGNVDDGEVYQTYEEREWMKDMRNVYEVYETITPRFTVPNPDYDKNEAVSLGSHLLPNLKSLEVSFRDDDGILDFCALFARCHPSPTLRHIRLRFPLALVSSSDAFSQLDDTFSVLPHTQVSIAGWISCAQLSSSESGVGRLILLFQLSVHDL
ncbi:hypothetical protein ABKN59_009764 [Abortiporus biennis]